MHTFKEKVTLQKERKTRVLFEAPTSIPFHVVQCTWGGLSCLAELRPLQFLSRDNVRPHIRLSWRLEEMAAHPCQELRRWCPLPPTPPWVTVTKCQQKGQFSAWIRRCSYSCLGHRLMQNADQDWLWPWTLHTPKSQSDSSLFMTLVLIRAGRWPKQSLSENQEKQQESGCRWGCDNWGLKALRDNSRHCWQKSKLVQHSTELLGSID